MAITFQFYSDPALTTPIRASLMFSQAVASPDPVDMLIYFGSQNAACSAQASSNPGIDPIEVAISSSGAGALTADVRLATSAAGLALATGGAPLALGVTLAGGRENATPIHIRVLDSTHVAGLFDNLSLTVGSIEETS